MNGTRLFARTARRCAALAATVTLASSTVCNAATIHVSMTGTVLSGITFRNGRYSDSNDHYGNMLTLGGAVRLSGTTTVVTNCAFENCSSAYGGGGGLYVVSGSTVVDCSFENCTGGLDGIMTAHQQKGTAGAAFACASPKVARNTVFPERSFLELPCRPSENALPQDTE